MNPQMLCFVTSLIRNTTSLPLWAGVHVALLELWCGFGVLGIAVTVVLRQGLVGSDVYTLCRVQLIT